jgi:hypothetical protein
MLQLANRPEGRGSSTLSGGRYRSEASTGHESDFLL